MRRELPDTSSHLHINAPKVHWYEKPLFIIGSLALVIVVSYGVDQYEISRRDDTSAAQQIPAKIEPIGIAAVGDSITFGSGLKDEELEDSSYPAQLQLLLGDAYEVTNYGIGGATLLMGTNNTYRERDNFDISRRLSPDVVLIMLGTNDVRSNVWSVADYEAQFVSFINEYKDLTSKPEVYILTPPAIYQDLDENGKSKLEREVVPAVFRIAEKTDTRVINIFSATKDHPEYFPDDVHLNKEGYKVIAETVYDSIK